MFETRDMEDQNNTVQKLLKTKPPEVLWHYTSLDGLFGIVHDRAIRATDVRYLNDRREYVHAYELLKAAMTERMQGLDDFGRYLLRQTESLVDVFAREQVRVFATSFSASDDQLSQWRAYGSSVRGVSIGFDFREFRLAEADTSASVFAPCVYSSQQQQRMIESWIDQQLDLQGEFFRQSQKNVALTMKVTEQRADLESLIGLFDPAFFERYLDSIMNTGRLCALMKHDSFSEENEWRLVSAFSRSRQTKHSYRRSVRISERNLVPYLNIPLLAEGSGGEGARIVAIKVGPHPEPELAIDAINDLLAEQEMMDVRVEASRIPFRSW